MAGDFGELSEAEKSLIEWIGTENMEEVKTLIARDDVRVDCLDNHGMTLLQHAAYKGSKEICELLLAHGADVNSRHHDHGYSALMFAALSGSTIVTQLILEAGANVSHENSVGRNAAQMAAFVGQHQCVSVINNFFSREDLQYYCSPRGLEKEPKLPPLLCGPLYKLIISHNLHPVKMSMLLEQSPLLLDERYKVAKVVDLLLEKMMKQSHTNEVMAVKFHYLASLVRHCDKWRGDHDGSLEGWIKLLVKGRPTDGVLETQEMFIRSVIKSFPYVESQLLQQMVRTLAPVKVGDSPTAFSILNSGINGQRFASEEDALCATCGDFKAQKKCSACKMVNYCEHRCQKLDWGTHKKFCKELSETRKQIEERRRQEEEAKAREELKSQQNQQEGDNLKNLGNDTQSSSPRSPESESQDTNEVVNTLPSKDVPTPGSAGDIDALKAED